ncbi:MAG: C4-dicarboxylate ABC transporter permease, partial [Burkholderiaceae bacterium]
MTTHPIPSPTQGAGTGVSEEALARAGKYVEEEEGAANTLHGWRSSFVRWVLFGMSVFHLYAAYDIVATQILRPIHVGFVLFLCFLLFPISPRYRHRIMWWDWL